MKKKVGWIAVREDYVNAAPAPGPDPLQRLLGRGISDPASRFCERLKKWFPGGLLFLHEGGPGQRAGQPQAAIYGWLVELRNAGAVKQVNESGGNRSAIWQATGPEVETIGATTAFVLPTADLVFGPNVAA